MSLLLGQLCFSEWSLVASFPGFSSLLLIFCPFRSPSLWISPAHEQGVQFCTTFAHPIKDSLFHKRKDSPFSAMLDNMQKYVASTTLSEPLSWSNSTLLKGDAAEAVARLKGEPGKDLVVMGSGELVQSLMRGNLVDEYVLLIHPLVLGSGRRLFPDGGAFAALRLADTKTTTNGVVIATYQPDEPTARKTTEAATH